jgi:hypothetical protein
VTETKECPFNPDKAERGGGCGAAGQERVPDHLHQRGEGGEGLPPQHGGYQGLVRCSQGQHHQEQDQVNQQPSVKVYIYIFCNFIINPSPKCSVTILDLQWNDIVGEKEIMRNFA